MNYARSSINEVAGGSERVLMLSLFLAETASH
jgi:hypothetical protein